MTPSPRTDPPAVAVSSTDTAPAAPPVAPRRKSHAWPWLLLLVVLGLAGWFGRNWWQAHDARQRDALIGTDQRLEALDDRIDGLRRDQRAQNQRLQQADATNRVLRDELLGIGQRSTLIEDTVAKLADPDRHGAQALRLDEAELLLTMGQQRLQVAGDLDGARRAYALAAGVLDGVDDPAYLSLRQTLVQERAGLDAIGAEPRVRAMARLEAFAHTQTLPPSRTSTATDTRDPWWKRAFGSIVQVQPTDRAVAVHPADRSAALAGLQLEISLARAAAERRDQAGYRAALARADAWLTRLHPESATLRNLRDELRQIAAMPLSLSLATLGSTLQQLRQLRTAR